MSTEERVGVEHEGPEEIREELPAQVEPAEAVAGARDATNWAKHVSTLHVADAPAEAANINVEGRRLASPIQGFGKMWQKTFQAALPAEAISATELIALWKQRFPEFWPEGNRFYAPLTGIAPGEVALIEGALPGKLKLSTGVMVLYADQESFTLMTPQGHVFAGWITFSAIARDDQTVAQVQLLMRASDPIFEVGMILGGHGQEERFWEQTLTNLAAHFGHEAAVDSQSVCVDSKRQWRNARNVWHSSAIRSTIYMLGAPLRVLRGRRQRRPVA